VCILVASLHFHQLFLAYTGMISLFSVAAFLLLTAHAVSSIPIDATQNVLKTHGTSGQKVQLITKFMWLMKLKSIPVDRSSHILLSAIPSQQALAPTSV